MAATSASTRRPLAVRRRRVSLALRSPIKQQHERFLQLPHAVERAGDQISVRCRSEAALVAMASSMAKLSGVSTLPYRSLAVGCFHSENLYDKVKNRVIILKCKPAQKCPSRRRSSRFIGGGDE